MDRIDCAVIGAGVVGLAVARAMSLRGFETVVIESENAIGTVTSSRNSEVIHAGLYYAAGSLKARLCVQGKQLLYAYCAERGISHQRCGKLVVATSEDQVPRLRSIQQQAAINGLEGADALQWLTREEALRMEPALNCIAALNSPSTGIVSSHELMLALQADLEHAGGSVALLSPVLGGQCTGDGVVLHVGGENLSELHAKRVINCAGLQAQRVALSLQGLPAQHVPQAYYAKGSYFALSGRAPFKRLIYPVPIVGGLGVHLTLDMAGQARFGPDAEWVTPTEQGFDYRVYADRSANFYSYIRKYWPELPNDALRPAYSGVRPKLYGPSQATADFSIQGPNLHGTNGLVNCYGIESPGLTSCLAIAAYIENLLEN
jgi:L-2-hydroxyglutarate oxidase LhgO